MQVGDLGIDGRIYPVGAMPIKAAKGGTPKRAVASELGGASTDTPKLNDNSTLGGATQDSSSQVSGTQGELDFMEAWYPIQVKQKDRASRPDIDAFETAMNRAERAKGFFISFAFTDDAMAEVQRYFVKEHKTIVPLTVKEIVEEQIARKLV